MTDVSISLNPAWLEELAPDIAATLDKMGEKIVDNAKRIVPVETGKLRDSISHHMDGDNTVVITADTPYAAYVELGTSKMAAQPYLRPALFSVAEGEL